MPIVTPTEWSIFLEGRPAAHLLQTPQWGELKAAFGWKPVFLLTGAQGQQTGALILFRRLPLDITLAYIPKGPVGWGGGPDQAEIWAQFWAEVDRLCREKRSFFLKVEPDLWELPGSPGQAWKSGRSALPAGFRLSTQTIQPPRTLVIDLQGEDEQVLGRMKQKTRYNIRLALKKGVVTCSSSDLDSFHHLLLQTGQRESFGVHSLAYYRKAYELFHPRGACELIQAEYEGEILGGLMVFAQGQRAWYLYGGSASEHRDRMPNYLLQWEAMRWARDHGCTEYDLWGVPDVDEKQLESNFTERDDGLWGVYRFKRGFSGDLRRAAGPLDRVYQPILYAFYRWWTKHRDVDN
jgi:lipid II:glycine glycyltransferase (peptidoglycan interpeptide bridge formation enzyme)